MPPTEILAHGLRDPARTKLYVARSTDPDAGWGLFAKVHINNGAAICQYHGRINPANPSAAYAYKHPNLPHIIDAFDPDLLIMLCLAGYINEPLVEARENATFFTRNGKLYLKATRPIRPDEQIFAHYGYGYWRDLAHLWPLPLLYQIIERYINDINLTSPAFYDLPHIGLLWTYLYGSEAPLYPPGEVQLHELPTPQAFRYGTITASTSPPPSEFNQHYPPAQPCISNQPPTTPPTIPPIPMSRCENCLVGRHPGPGTT